MMMMGNRNGAGTVAKWVIGLLLLMMGIRMLIFVLAAVGLINWGGFSGTSWLWVMPVLMVLMMGVMFLVMPRLMHPAPGPGAEESPSQILQKRFARGELTKEQYEQKEEILREHASPQK